MSPSSKPRCLSRCSTDHARPRRKLCPYVADQKKQALNEENLKGYEQMGGVSACPRLPSGGVRPGLWCNWQLLRVRRVRAQREAPRAAGRPGSGVRSQVQVPGRSAANAPAPRRGGRGCPRHPQLACQRGKVARPPPSWDLGGCQAPKRAPTGSVAPFPFNAPYYAAGANSAEV
jgi:hypothetical protein